MFSVRLISGRNKKPFKNEKIFVTHSFIAGGREEWT